MENLDSAMLEELAVQAQEAAEKLVTPHGCRALTIVVAPDGAYRVAATSSIGINEFCGLLARASADVSSSKREPWVRH